jgi:MSHA pilin protein MshC
MKKSRGFTLVEVVVTLVLLGILALVVLPRFATVDTYSARGFYDEASALVRFAQKRAIARRQSVFVIADSSSKTICLSDVTAVNCNAPTGVLNPATGEPFSKTAPSGVTLSSASFAFSGLGSPTPNNAVTINVVGDGQTRTITVERETGYVH